MIIPASYLCYVYRGYTIRRMPYSLRLGAYSQGTGSPWFEGATETEVKDLIDKALEDLPDPVYWDMPGKTDPEE